ETTVLDAATRQPLAGARVGLAPFPLTGADGLARSDPTELPYPGTPIDRYDVGVTGPEGYWSSQAGEGWAPLRPDETTHAQVARLKKCDGATIFGTVLNALTQAPIGDATVRWGFGPLDKVQTAADGTYLIPNVPVGVWNQPNQI